MSELTSSLERALERVAPSIDGVVVEASRQLAVAARGRWIDGLVPSSGSFFYAASLTKQVIGLLVAIAEEAGEPRTEDSVRGRLPAMPWSAETITVDHLLHHTSGLPRELSGSGTRSTATVLAALAELEVLPAAPGDRFEYSNDAYVLLAAMLEHASGASIDQLAAERVFTPLGMTSSVLASRPIVAIPDEPPPPATRGDGGWWATTTDVGRLLRHLNRDKLGTRVMQRGQLASAERIDYARGVRITSTSGFQTASHGGTWERWQSKTLRIPERECTVVVAARSHDAQTVSDLGNRTISDIAGLR